MKRGNVASVSASLTIGGKFNDFRNAMGIDRESALSSMVEPAVHGRLDFHAQAIGGSHPEWIDAVVKTTVAALKAVPVATTSHDLSALLGVRMPGAVAIASASSFRLSARPAG